MLRKARPHIYPDAPKITWHKASEGEVPASSRRNPQICSVFRTLSIIAK